MNFNAIKNLGASLKKTVSEATKSSADKINLKKEIFQKEGLLLDKLMEVFEKDGSVDLTKNPELGALMTEVRDLRAKDSLEFKMVSEETKAELKSGVELSVSEAKKNMEEKFGKKETVVSTNTEEKPKV